MFKRIISFLLAAIMVVGVLPGTAIAAEIEMAEVVEIEETAIPETTEPATTEPEETVPETTVTTVVLEQGTVSQEAVNALSGSCGPNLTWELNGSTLVISGTGEMTGAPWTENYEDIHDVSLPEGLTSIAEAAFLNCYYVFNIDLPDSVTSIGNRAFAAAAVRELTIPAAVTSLGSSLFSASCSKLIFMGSAPSIAVDAFRDITAEILYPAADASWTEEVRQNYGGTITWTAYGRPAEDLTPQQRFEAAMAKAKAEKTGYTLSEELTLTEDLIVDVGEGLLGIDNYGAVTVPEGKTLTFRSDAEITFGAIYVEYGGSLILEPGVTLTCSGTLEVAKGASITVPEAGAVVCYLGDWVEITGVDKKLRYCIGYPEDGASLDDVMNEIARCHAGEAWMQYDITLTEDVTIPANASLNSWGMNLTVPRGFTLTNLGHMMMDPAVITVSGGAKLKNYGVISLLGGAVLNVEAGGTLVQHGDSVLDAAGGRVENNGSSETTQEIPPEFIPEEEPVDYITEKELQAEFDKYAPVPSAYYIYDKVILQKDFTFPSKMIGLVLTDGAKIIVPDGVTLTIDTPTNIWSDAGIYIEHGGKLIVDSNVYASGIIQNRGEYQINRKDTGEKYYINTYYRPPAGGETGISGIAESDQNLWIQPRLEGTLPEIQKLLNETSYNSYQIILQRDTVLDIDLTIPQNAELTSDVYGTQLTIPQGITLTNNGTISFQSQNLNNYGTVENNGIVTLGGSLNNAGVINLNGYSYTYIETSGKVVNNGRITLYPGGMLEVDGVWEGTEVDDQGGGIGGDEFSITQEELEVLIAEGKPLTDPVTLERNLTLTKPLTVQTGGMITVPKNVTLTIKDTLSIYTGGSLLVETGGKLVNNSYLVSHNGDIRVEGSYINGNRSVVEVLCSRDSIGTIEGIPTKYQYVEFSNVSQDTFLAAMNMENYAWVSVYNVDLTLDADVTIPKNTSVVVQGKFQVNSNVTVLGNLTAEWQSTMENRGTITVRKGGRFEVLGSYTGNAPANDGGEISGDGFVVTPEELESLVAEGKPLTGLAVLDGSMTLRDKELIIEEGGRLVVPKDVTLTVNHTMSVHGSLEVQSGGKLVNNDGLLVYPEGAVQIAGSYTHGASAYVQLYSKEPSLPAVKGIAKKYLWVQLGDVGLELFRYALSLQKDGYGAIRLYSDGLTLDENVTIPKVMSLVIDGGSLTINKALTLNGSIVVESKLVNNGSFTMNKGSELYVYGTWEGNRPVNNGGMTYPYAESVAIAEGDALTMDIVEAKEQRLTVTVEGDNVLQCVAWTSSNKKVVDPADIKANGDGTYTIVKAGVGTATLTATSVATDDKGKTFKDTIDLTITDVAVIGLTLSHNALEESTEDQAILVKNGQTKTFTITPHAATNHKDAEKPLTKKDIKWTISNSALASVKTLDNGSAEVTVKAGASGTAVITAQLTSQKDMTGTLDLAVMDYQPKLEKTAFNMNTKQTVPAVTARLTEQVRAIEEIRLYEYDKTLKGYSAAESTRFKAGYADGTLTITKETGEEKTAVQLLMTVKCEGVEEPFKYELKISMKNSIPAVTIKQPVKLNTFYLDSTTELVITAKDAKVVGVDILNAEGEMITGEVFDAERGILTLKLEKPEKKLDNKLDLEIQLEGYEEKVKKTVSISNGSTKPSLVLSAASSTIYGVFGAGSYEIAFTVCNKADGTVADCGGTVASRNEGTEVSFEKGEVRVTVPGVRNDTLTIMAQASNWAEPIKLTHGIKVEKNAPKIKLSASTVRWNTYFYDEEAQECTEEQTIQVSLDKKVTGIQIADIKVLTDGEIPVTFDYDSAGGVMTMHLKKADKAKYVCTLVPVISDGVNEVELDVRKNGVKLTIQAENKTPKVSQSAKGKLDAIDPSSEILYTISKISDAMGRIEDVKLLLSDGTKDEKGKLIYKESRKFVVSLGEEVSGTQTVVLKLDPQETYDIKANYKFKLEYGINGEFVETNELSVKVTQSGLKVTAPNAAYDLSQSLPLDVNVNLTAPVNAKLAQITVNRAKTSKELVAALGMTEDMTFQLDAVKSASLSLPIGNTGSLTAGKSYKLVLDITPVGHAGNAKVTQITVTVKIAK